MDPITASAAIAAGTQIVGGLFSRKSRKSAERADERNFQEAKRQFDIQTNESIQRRVADGLKAGINPLAAIGASVNYSPTISAGGGYGGSDFSGEANSIANAGKIISEAMLAKQNDDMVYDSEAKELDLEGKRLENRILKQRLESMSKPGEPKSNGPTFSNPSGPSMQGEELLFRPVYDIQGRPRLVINQNALEADADNPGYMSSIINVIGNAMINNQITPDGRIVSPQLQMLIDDFYYQTTGHHIKNLESLYVSPTEAAMAAAMLGSEIVNGVN